MQFNTWIFGEHVIDGISKLSKHIKINKPDIVSLQEVQTKEVFEQLLQKLGPEWSGAISPCTTNSNIAIVTIHQIMNEMVATNTSHGANIKLKNTNEIISFWCLHLDWQSYGPYAANNKKVTKLEQIMKGEYSPVKDARGDDILALLEISEFQEALKYSNQNPIILCGDFNTPSHLDWIEENKDIHGGWIVEWPASYLLQTKAGLIDSFREIHPDPIKTPGITWSTVHQSSGYEWDYSIPEPLDRIDFIMYKSPKIKPVNSFTYSGNKPLQQMPNHENNDYPSDHFAVITDFLFK
uniref:Endonuclease/exonuclease/phosphatase domain-containing protein n=1 Tax=Panagrolaimus sp. ES5 TaxID=591445 RepID=A0AC34FEG9_9BILA